MKTYGEWTYDGYTMDQIKFFLEQNLISKPEARWLFGLEQKLSTFHSINRLGETNANTTG